MRGAARKPKGGFLTYAYASVLLALALLFIAKFAGPSLLRLYIQGGLGDCSKMTVFCKLPWESFDNAAPDGEFIDSCIDYDFPKMSALAPRGFSVVHERITRVPHKKKVDRKDDSIIYFYHEGPDFFVNLFPQVKKTGISDDYKFIERVMNARFNEISTIADAFYVIVKGVFTPDLGKDQAQIRMARFAIAGKKGFINYSLGTEANFFDCNVIDKSGYFKVYIKDKGRQLDINKVLFIVSTLRGK